MRALQATPVQLGCWGVACNAHMGYLFKFETFFGWMDVEK